MSPSLKILSLVATSVVAILVVAGVVGTWTLQAWPNPLLPTLYFASAMFALFIVMGAAWFVVTRREIATGVGAEGASAEERGLQRLVALTATVTIGVIALAVIGAWNVDVVRTRFVESRVTHVQLEQVLEDPSPIVRLAACQELFQRGWAFRSEKAIIAALDPQPAMAVKCLQTAKEKDWKGIRVVASKLNDGWTAAMMRTDATGVPAACELAPWSPVVSELAEQPSEPRLLHCATGAATPAVRQCCANTIAGRGKLLDLLGEPDDMDAESVAMLFPKLIQMSFAPLTLSAEDQKVVATLQTDDEAMRKWLVQLGCGKLDPTEPQPELLGGLMPLVEADSCNLTAAEETKYNSPVEWARLCEQVFASEEDKPVQQLVCDGVQDARVMAAVEIAAIRVHEAIRAPFLERDAEFVDMGTLSAQRMGGGKTADDDKIEEFRNRSAVDALRLTSYADPTCRKVSLPNIHGGVATKRHQISEYTTTDCKRYRRDLTVGEYAAQNPGYGGHKKLLDDLRGGWWKHEKIKEASKGEKGKRALRGARQKMDKIAEDVD